ncbi:ATPase AAA [Actinotalea ferrariae CF5-4]|uniref:RecBCD enzyme subunit RecB n=1 Tax=Actinotalea ferrariae CF5-4 TaxID=948458 RepID=A0A021VTP4_9CELL|nr:UvrD-helicase domain-containing protein [Actinotalea ferrariae]EYR64574.1 ATPase AAA [Actinotalea ferrariae CF5-4]
MSHDAVTGGTTTTTAPHDAGSPRVFDVCGPLPERTTVLEASAGTGKTFTIAALATRYVAEGVAELSELMLVTFGRAATSELRDRVRERLVSAERALRDPAVRRSDDALLRHLADVDDTELDARRRRLTRALAEFDRATIATTHGFCQQMLATLGIAGDTDPDAVLLPDVADLREEVVDDLYLQRYAVEREPGLSVTDARAVARAAVSDHDADLRPTDATGTADHRYRFAADVRAEIVRRKRARRLIDYDDLLTLLRDALTHPQTGPAAVERVRSRYRVVMVDEFQDTDRVQWDILRTAFHGHRTLVLIGDPKQAIYAFRGADVVTYLAARRDAHDTATLGRNWRSDAAVLEGLHHVLGTTALGDRRIVVRRVEAQHTGRRHDGAAAVRLRQVTRAALGTPSGTPSVGDVRELVYADVAAQVVQQLRTERLLDDGTDGGWRPVRPGDVAVLCRRNADALAVRDALTTAGVPAVVSGLSSVFRTDAAGHWHTLLVALDQPGHAGRGAAAALTPFVGWDAARLAGADDDARDHLAERLRAWAHVLAERGVAALLEAATAAGLTERLLGSPDGERLLTDVRHIGQVLHEAAVRQQLGAAALTEWLRARVAEADQDYAEERSRRLETDAEAVQVVTVHAAKGLEFPIVHVPFAWDRFTPKNPPILQYHDGDERLLHVGGAGSSGYAEALVHHQAEDVGEDLRLAYVALTRAASHVVLWWAPSRTSGGGALTRLLLGDRDEGGEPPAAVTVPRDAVVTERLAALAAASAGSLAHELVTTRPEPTRWVAPEAARQELSVARFTRRLDSAWRRTSYSGLTAAAHHAYGTTPVVADEPDDAGIQDEPGPPAAAATEGTAEGASAGTAAGTATGGRPTVPGTTAPGWATSDDALRALPSPMADLPGGTAFGTLVHEVLEHVDTAAPDLEAEVLRRCQETPLGRSLGVDASTLAQRLTTVLDTPLGPLGTGVRLRDVAPVDRLPELEFELPLAGGDTPTGPASTLRDIATLLRRHLPADDPFAPYAGRLEHPDLAGEHLRGYLTGSIDAVLRVRDETGTVRHLVVDYKTNRLAGPEEDLTLWHYRPAALAAAMMDAHYPLQLLLYAAALHRFLRWRLPGYDPDRHLGGGLYLFVRGMAGPDTPAVDGHPCGVMAWRPPTAVVLGVSALLEGRQP